MNMGPVHNGGNHVPKPFWIAIQICALRGNILFLLALIDPCMASVCISKMRTHETRSERDLRSHVRLSTWITIQNASFCAFQNAYHFQKPDLKELCVHKGLNQAFKSVKGPNHVPKRLSERDSFLCEQARCQFSHRACSQRNESRPESLRDVIRTLYCFESLILPFVNAKLY